MDQPTPEVPALPAELWARIDAFLAAEDIDALSQVNKATQKGAEQARHQQGIGDAHGPAELAALAADPNINIILVRGGTIDQDYPDKTIVAYGPVAVTHGTVYARHSQASITAVTGGMVYASGSAQVSNVTGGLVYAVDSVKVSNLTGGGVVVDDQVTVSLGQPAAFNRYGQVVWADDPTVIVVAGFPLGMTSVPATVSVSDPNGPVAPLTMDDSSSEDDSSGGDYSSGENYASSYDDSYSHSDSSSEDDSSSKD